MSFRSTLTTIGRHPSATLLAAQLVAVIAYPFLSGTEAGRAVLGALQLVVIANAVRAVRPTPALTYMAVVLGMPTMVFAVWEAVSSDTQWVVITSAALHVPFYAYVSYAFMRYLFSDDRVTTDELWATAAAFTVVAWGFAYLYEGVQAIWPGSFGASHDWYDLLYFSFTNLTSVGVSDLVPALGHARSAVILEQVAGVFYLALVVSRLVGLAIGRQHSHHDE